MVDPITIGLIIGVCTLAIERIASLLSRWKRLHSSCCLGRLELDMDDKIDPNKDKI
jgi:hypothetical protein